MHKSRIAFYLITALLLISFTGSAQYYTKFGHNRIQYKSFDWYYYSTNSLEVYYYQGGKEYALQALDYLDKEYNELTDLLGYAPYAKTKIFIYNSVQDLQQSNVGVGGEIFTLGGKTDFVKLQVEIAYTGDALGFRQQIVDQLSNVLINDMMYGGNLAEMFQNSYLLSLPSWFIDGASKYFAYGWSDDMDDYVRDYLQRTKVKGYLKVQDENAPLIGQSVWNFLVVKYGQGIVSNVLNLTRIIRNEERSISTSLGISYKSFLNDWKEYYLNQDREILESYESPDLEKEIASPRNRQWKMTNAKVNSAGTKLAYTYHKSGKFHVVVEDLEKNRKIKLLTEGFVIYDQEINYNLPLLDWKSDNELGVLVYKRGYLYLNTYNIDNGQKLQKPLGRFRQIVSFSFNDNGKLAIISGDIDGQNDLFLVSMRRNALKRITNDVYDDLDPVFIPGTAAVVFSSNRLTDSVSVEAKQNLNSLSEVYNLFLYDLDTTTYRFQQITNTYGIDKKPQVINQSMIYYISDQKGISNLYAYNLKDSMYHQVTNFAHGIIDYDLTPNGENLSYVMLENGKQMVFNDESFDIDKSVFTPQTARKRFEQAKFIVSRMKLPGQEPEEEKKKEDDLTSVLEVPKPAQKKDSVVLADHFQFEDENVSADSVTQEVQEELPDDWVNINNYVFESERSGNNQVNKPSTNSFFAKHQVFKQKNTRLGPLGYEPLFSFSNVISSVRFDPLMGMSFLFETKLTDLVENHQLTAGALVNSFFNSIHLYAEYKYLKNRVDFGVRLDRKSYLFDFDEYRLTVVQRYMLNNVEFVTFLPFTNSFRAEIAPQFTSTQFLNLEGSRVVQSSSVDVDYAEDATDYYGGLNASLVFDNTRNKDFNIYFGTKALLKYSYSAGLSEKSYGFSKLTFDLRHHQQVHKEIVFATRLFYGKSGGSKPPSFLVGGVDNWIFRQFQNFSSDNPLNRSVERNSRSLLFSDFVTGLRGFDLSEVMGSQALVANAELRFPIFRYFSRGPIASNFVRNFQLIGFYDIGAAWDGNIPIGPEKDPVTQYYQEGSYEAEIEIYHNPWLSSYGWGLRTVLFGYYVKLDVAKPIRDYHIGNTRVYLSIGLDF